MSSVVDLLESMLDPYLIHCYIVISAACVFFYDYLLTLHLEIKLIWFSRWNYTKVLFLVLRYTSFILVILFLENKVIHNIEKTCKVLNPMQWWMIILQATLAEVILSIRTWAVWKRNKTIGIILALSILASLIPQSILLYNFTRLSESAPPLYLGFNGCFEIIVDMPALMGTYATLTGIQAIFLSLMVIAGIRSYNSCRDGSIGKLSFIIYRDGILFYIYILCMSLANLFAIIIPTDTFVFLLIPMESAMYAVFTTRIILNIRYFGNRTCLQTELHTIYEESHPTSTPIQFALHNSELSQSTGRSQLSLQESQGGGDCADTPSV